MPGGNGLRFDWTILSGHRDSPPFALAGGLDADNVAQAIRLTHAPIVDVSSGVESAPGIKDPAKIAAFIANAKKPA
jgi:phosphoribosylanthranilate isomerase